MHDLYQAVASENLQAVRILMTHGDIKTKDVNNIIQQVKALQVKSPLTSVCGIAKMTNALDSTVF